MIRIGIYGANGHQISRVRGPGRIVAAAEAPVEALRDLPIITVHKSLERLLEDPAVELVSLCSPRRRDQAAHAIQALRAGKHVYAEKPCAMSEADLDAILAAARETGRMFREMAGTAFEQPYLAMREIVRAGEIGEVVQVICEKSYPWHPGRPQDEDVDGGLIGQCAIHGLRFVEHVAGVRIRSIDARQTGLGNPVAGGSLQMAATLMLELENGGIASVCANYLNQRTSGVWGDDSLRILGARGFVESRQGGRFTQLISGESDRGALDISKPNLDYLAQYLNTIAGEAEMPLSLEEELSPTRWAIRGRK